MANVETVAKAHEAGALDGGVDVQHPGQNRRLVGQDPHGPPVQASQADNDVLGPVFLDLKEVIVIHVGMDDVADIIGLVGIGRHHLPQVLVAPAGIVGGLDPRGVLGVVLRQKGQELPHLEQAGAIIKGGKVSHAALGIVGHGTAQVFLVHVLLGDRLDHFGTGDEHVAGIFDHEDPVRQGRRIHRAAGRRAHDGGDLGNHARGHDVVLENLPVAGQAHHPFLDTGTARIVQADHRRAGPEAHFHDLADLFRMRQGERAPEGGKILGVDESHAAVNLTVAGDDPVARDLLLGHVEIGASMGLEAIQFHKGVGIEQGIDPLPGGHLALRVLLFDAFRPPAFQRLPVSVG